MSPLSGFWAARLDVLRRCECKPSIGRALAEPVAPGSRLEEHCWTVLRAVPSQQWHLSRAYRALFRVDVFLPRAAPWAIIARPFGALGNRLYPEATSSR